MTDYDITQMATRSEKEGKRILDELRAVAKASSDRADIQQTIVIASLSKALSDLIAEMLILADKDVTEAPALFEGFGSVIIGNVCSQMASFAAYRQMQNIFKTNAGPDRSGMQ